MKWKKAAFLLALALLAYSPARALNLSDLLTQSRVFLRDTATDSSRQRFSDAQLTAFVNNGQKEINAHVWCVVGSSSLVLTAGTTEYSLPSDQMTVLRVTLNGAPLIERTFSFLDETNVSWISDPPGVPREYYLRVDSSVVSNVSRESIGVHPVSSFTATLTIQYLQQPADLSGGSDIPFAGNLRLFPYHQALAYYAAYRGWMSRGMKDDAAVYYRDYSNVVQSLGTNDRSKVLFNPNLRGNMPVPVPAQGGQQQ